MSETLIGILGSRANVTTMKTLKLGPYAKNDIEMEEKITIDLSQFFPENVYKNITIENIIIEPSIWYTTWGGQIGSGNSATQFVNKTYNPSTGILEFNPGIHAQTGLNIWVGGKNIYVYVFYNG